MDFQHNTTRTADAVTLTLSGRLDTLSATQLEAEVKEIVADPGKALVVDIASLSYISSSGLRCFVELLKGCRAAAVPMTIAGMQPAIREIFDLTGFSKVFDIK